MTDKPEMKARDHRRLMLQTIDEVLSCAEEEMNNSDQWNPGQYIPYELEKRPSAMWETFTLQTDHGDYELKLTKKRQGK